MGFHEPDSLRGRDKEFPFEDKSNQQVWWDPTLKAIASMIQKLKKNVFRHMTVLIPFNIFRILAFYIFFF